MLIKELISTKQLNLLFFNEYVEKLINKQTKKVKNVTAKDFYIEPYIKQSQFYGCSFCMP